MHYQFVGSKSFCPWFVSRRARASVSGALAFTVIYLAGATGALAQSLPSGWSSRDVGNPVLSGGASHASGVYTIDAAGTDIWDSSDQFHFVYRQMSGDFDVRARVDSITNAHHWSKAGVMVRSALTAGASHAYSLVSSGRGAAFQRRRTTGGQSTHTDGPSVAPPRWVRLVRTGNQVIAYSSANGSSWTEIGRDTITLGTSVYVGLAVTSHNANQRTTARISNVSVSPLGLPAGQTSADIGGPAVRGSATYSNGAYTVSAGGIDIWDRSDEFHYVYQPVQGDVTVTARVASVTRAHEWSKAGVMIRETLDADSAHAFAFVSAGRGYGFQRRPSAGGLSEHSQGLTSGAPGWIRLVRSGSVFEAYQSTNGTSWTLIDRRTIGMVSSVYVGIAVTSHNVSAATTAVLDNLQITQSQPPGNQPPAVSLTSPTQGATFTAPATVSLAATASDADGSVSRVDFYAGSTLIGSDSSAPYTASWQNVPAGSHTLTAVAADDDGATTTSAGVTITVSSSSPGSLPSGQTGADIGSPALAGSATYLGGVYTIRAGGVDIWESSDQFHFVYQQVSGDVTITARVASLTRAHDWSKAGVMIRESLTGGSRNAFTLASAARGHGLSYRSQTNGVSTLINAGVVSLPRWVRLVRRGSTFEAYSSSNGTSWTLVGSQTITMGSSVYVGVAVTSHNAGALTTATIDNVDISAGETPENQPPTVSITSPTQGAQFTAPATLTVTASASDSDGTVARVDFYAGTTLIGTDTSAPFAVNWQNVPAGAYSLTAVARDDDGATRTSGAVSITVNPVATEEPPTGIVFVASTDHATMVTSYRFEVYNVGATPGTSTPVASTSLGKPQPASNGEITVSLTSFFDALAPGDYIAVVAAIGSGGTSRSTPVTFTK